ncbi:hypothetical protein IQ241_00280 [Romeria aff. gracilis LEGE 07310]|uniref:NIDO domain-containing protein n=1 Tax=Vasconcelosia minhoensis LEGE 07310 TaxID=915328 RepID=A0A8J7AHX7_9CYAN|nr:nidogen-like domain-containing protein [Romeria gracilis]MBE9075750.1 hypothetical protein [Romeria aff. gracilis LEGE 07310]
MNQPLRADRQDSFVPGLPWEEGNFLFPTLQPAGPTLGQDQIGLAAALSTVESQLHSDLEVSKTAWVNSNSSPLRQTVTIPDILTGSVATVDALLSRATNPKAHSNLPDLVDAAGDLNFDKDTANKPGKSSKFKVKTTSQGEAETAGTSKLKLFSSSKKTLDSTAIEVGEVSTQLKLKPKQSKTVSADIQLPDTLSDSYTLFAAVDTDDAISETNDFNNISIPSASLLSEPRTNSDGSGSSSSSNALISGLGTPAAFQGQANPPEFGENYLDRNDDDSSDFIDITSVFESGINFFGTTYTGFYINNNGNITFNEPLSSYVPFALTGNTGVPIIAPFFADVDTLGGAVPPSAGGTSTGSNLVYWDLDPVTDTVTVTWDDVGSYSLGTVPNAFQVQLKDRGNGNFDMEYIYEAIDWVSGDASNGVVALAGYSAANGVNFYELPESGNASAMLELDTNGNSYQFSFEAGSDNQPPVEPPSTPLISGLGTPTEFQGQANPPDFGENYLDRNDDGSSTLIDITSVFESGINFFGTTYTGFYINNNGNITFNSPISTYTPFAMTGNTNVPIIAPFFSDIDTQGGPVTPSAGGTSTGSNLVYWDLDPLSDTVTITWDDVGAYSWGTVPNAFQLQLKDRGNGDFGMAFIYEAIEWVSGDASNGVAARAGYSAANGVDFYELPESGNAAAMLELDTNGNRICSRLELAPIQRPLLSPWTYSRIRARMPVTV